MKNPSFFQIPHWRKLFDIFSLGILILINSTYFTWNSFAEVGFVTLAWTYFVFGLAYLALNLIIGELLCVLPFKGGAFGIVRCTIGLFPGYLAGFGEASYYIAYGSLNNVFLTELISKQLRIDLKYAPLLWIALYVSTCVILTQHKAPAFFWRFTNVLALLCLCLIYIYCFGSLSSLHFAVNGNSDFIATDAFGTFRYFPQAAWFFIGIETLPLACNAAYFTRETIAVGSVICFVTLFLTNFMSLCITFFAFTNPAKLASEFYPLNKGYLSFLDWSCAQASCLAFPSCFGALIAYTFSHGKLICALAESKLLPGVLDKKTAADSPYAALIAGCLLGYCICWPLHFFPQTSNSVLSQFCYLASFTIYGLYSLGYMVLEAIFEEH